MNVKELWAKLPHERAEQLKRTEVWRNAAIGGMTWAEAVLDGETAAEALHLLAPRAQEALRAVLLAYGAAPAVEEALLARLRGSTSMSGSECRLALLELESAGLLFAVKKVWGERLFFVPRDIYAIWLPLLYPLQTELVTGLIEPARTEDGRCSAALAPFGRRMLYGLAALAQSDMSFTGKGLLAKKTVSKLVDAIRLDETALLPFRLQWAHSGHYPLQIALFLEAASAIGLIDRGTKGLALMQAGVKKWLALSELERESELQNWLNERLLTAAGASGHPAAALIGAERGIWQKQEALEAWNEALSRAPLSGGAAGISSAGALYVTGSDARREEDWSSGVNAVARWLDVFAAFGWLERGEHYRNGRPCGVYRWRLLSTGGSTGIAVQPDGELLAGPDCGYEYFWELELIGERKSDDGLTVYAMTSASIARALEFGRSKTSIVRFLQAASGSGELAPTVGAMLSEWTARSGRYAFAEATLLRCDTEELADRAEGIPAIAPLLLDRIGPLCYAVDSGSVGEIRRLLAQAGYPARKGVATAVSAREADNAGIAYFAAWEEMLPDSLGVTGQHVGKEGNPSQIGSFLLDAAPLRLYELADIQGGIGKQMGEEARTVPTMWLRELRAYHSTTRRELIQKALALETSVQLKMGGELRLFIPESVNQRAGHWSVSGRLLGENGTERSVMTPDMWEEMKMVIPEGLGT